MKHISMVLPIGFYWTILFSSCNSVTDHKDEKKDSVAIAPAFNIVQHPFGKTADGDVVQYTLSNPAGMTVSILNYGGTITSIIVPDKHAVPGDVVLGFDSLSGYLQKNNPYLGASIGRYGNRIAHAKFVLDGKTYALAPNNDGNSLHGGLKGFDKVIWKATPSPGGSSCSLKLTYESRDGEEGFPGNLQVAIVFTLTKDNALKIAYTAGSDKPTPVNLTNHTYFNLSAGKDTVNFDHELRLNAGRFTAVNDQLIPTGKLPSVNGTPMDFTTPKKIGADILDVKGGYDHNYVLNKKANELSLAASVYEPGSGRVMDMYTTEPGVQFYTGNFLDGSLVGKNGIRYVKHAGFCLEAQHFPDSPNQPSFPTCILKPGETYQQTTIYKFSTR
ncbi:MAG TPA: aldose epimerase family protein [Puia sp.]|nr:aldose epimerase family protein [Puia sp.]